MSQGRGQIYGMLSPRLRQILAEPLNLTVVKCFRAQFNVITLDPRSQQVPYAMGSGLKSRRLLAEAIRHRDTEPVNCLTPDPCRTSFASRRFIAEIRAQGWSNTSLLNSPCSLTPDPSGMAHDFQSGTLTMPNGSGLKLF